MEKKGLKRIFSLFLSLLMIVQMFVGFTAAKEIPVYAATASQNNIVARADYMYDITWVCQQNVSGWNYNYTFYAGNTYHIPYGQPINSGYYIGYGVSVDSFVSSANTYGSVFYSSRSTYGTTSSVYYANDCSAFVSWCWGVDRKTTYSIPQISTYIGMATASNAYNLQLGDCLNSNDVGHVVLVTGLTYDSSGNLTQIEITEQTPPQLKRSYYTPSSLGAKYGTYYGIYRYYGTVPAAPDGYVNDDTSSGTITEITSKYYPACDSSYTSLIPAMASIGVTLDWELQCEVAELNGITDFSGTVEQNTTLLNLLKAGKLLNPNYVPVTYYPACDSSYTSFYPAMESLGYTVDWELHCDIAVANGISDFSGTVEQNTTLLNLLKAGKLIVPGTGSEEDEGGTESGGTSSGVTDGKTGYDRGYAGGMAGTGNYEAFGLDLSSWNAGAVNFASIKAAGYDYVILRAGTTKGRDTYFDTFYTQAKAAGLDVGAYYYSYATDVATAENDAENMLEYIAGKKYEYPIYFDYEDSTQQSLSSSLSQKICLAFMDKVAAEGYLVGMYTGQYFSTQLPMDTICAKYEVWIAHYLGSGTGYDGTDDYYKYGPTYASKYGMYQFTDSVRFTSGGSSWGPYDGDVAFKDYPTICKTYGFNGYASSIEEEEETYVSQCEFYPSHSEIKIKTATDIYSEPRSAKDTNTSVALEEAPLDTVYTATGLYKNTGGNLWYQVETSTGETGYIYSGRTTYIGEVTSDITLTGADVPNGHVKGNVFIVSGNISSKYNKLNEAQVYIYSGFGTKGEKVTGGSGSITNNSYTLANSAVDDATSFGTIDNGKYTYVIQATYTNNYAKTTKEVETINSTKVLAEEYFVVIPSSVSQSSCSHSNTSTVVKEKTCTEDGISITACSKCGLIHEETIAKAHRYGSYVETKAATCTEAGSKAKTCKDCGKVYTKEIAATGHSFKEATYEAPKTCIKCGETEGDPLVKEEEPLSGTLTVGGTTDAVIKTKGSSITLDASATGGNESYTYKFAVLNVSTGKWSVLRDFSSNSSYTYTLNYAGTKQFAVTVKDSTGKTVATNRITVKVTNPTVALSGTLQVNNSTETLTKLQGSKITLKAQGIGGSGSYTYKFAVLNVSTRKWSVLRDFNSNASYTYALNYAGTKQFAVTVKDSTGKTVATNRLTVKVVKETSELSAKLTSSVTVGKVGDSIKLTATALGGSGSYTYKFVVYNVNTNIWYTLKDYSASSTYTTKVSSAGAKQFVVSVKDSTGKVVSSERVTVGVTQS